MLTPDGSEWLTSCTSCFNSGRDPGRATESVWTFWRRKKKTLAPTEIWLPDYSPHSLVTTPTMLPWLQWFMICRHMQGLEVNADKTKYMVMFRDQDAGQSHIIKTDSRSFERVEEFKYLWKMLTNQNSIQEKLRACWSQGMLAIIRCRIFCLPVCNPKI